MLRELIHPCGTTLRLHLKVVLYSLPAVRAFYGRTSGIELEDRSSSTVLTLSEQGRTSCTGHVICDEAASVSHTAGTIKTSKNVIANIFFVNDARLLLEVAAWRVVPALVLGDAAYSQM